MSTHRRVCVVLQYCHCYWYTICVLCFSFLPFQFFVTFFCFSNHTSFFSFRLLTLFPHSYTRTHVCFRSESVFIAWISIAFENAWRYTHLYICTHAYAIKVFIHFRNEISGDTVPHNMTICTRNLLIGWYPIVHCTASYTLISKSNINNLNNNGYSTIHSLRTQDFRFYFFNLEW